MTPFQVNRIIIVSKFANSMARVFSIRHVVPKVISGIVSTCRFEIDKTYLGDSSCYSHYFLGCREGYTDLCVDRFLQ